MELFGPILNQMIVLALFIVIGFVLSHWKIVPKEAAQSLSKMETFVFVPAMIINTFVQNCTPEKLSSVWQLLLMSCALVAILVPVSLAIGKLLYKDEYTKKLAAYGLAFSNFGFMGNAVFMAIFPDIFFEYTIFTLPFWTMAYVWAVPSWLVPHENQDTGKKTLWTRVKPFINPLMVSVVIGAVLGLTGLGKYLPAPVTQVISVTGSCMSPLAMILMGLSLGTLPVLQLFKRKTLYIITLFRLIIYPLVTLGILYLLSLIGTNAFINDTFFVCAMCMVSMPIGLTAIFIAASYERDTSEVVGMVLLSSIASIVTIPLWFMLLQMLLL